MDVTANVAPLAKTACITGKPDWWPRWESETIAIVASGPTAKTAGVEQLQGKVRVIAINESWELCPWADVLYGCDGRWWNWRGGVPKFHGLKIWADPAGYDHLYKDIKKVTIANVKCNDILFDEPGLIGAGGNSGFQALNLAVQFGAKRILLIGYDMRIDFGEHWHVRHYPPLSNPHVNDNLPRWREALDGTADCLAKLGIQVINCSPVSLLKAYPKMSISEALGAK
jgi:hypothetical protein